MIGEDFKEIYKDIGRPYVRLNMDGTQSPVEYGKGILNSQATKPFTVLTTVRGFFPHDTVVRPGDVIHFLDEDSYYMVTVLKASVLEGAIKFFSGVLYMVNSLAFMSREVNGQRDERGDLIQGFVQQTQKIHCNLSDTMFGTTLLEDGRIAIGDVTRDNQTLYLPAPWVKHRDSGEQLFVEIGDRLHVEPLKPETCWEAKDYEVIGVRRNRYDNVHDLTLREDRR